MYDKSESNIQIFDFLKQLLPSKMGKISRMQLSNEEINTDEVAHNNDLPKRYFQLSFPQVHV